MTTRTTSRTMTFVHPFKLTGMDGEQPAGRYVVETDEELLEGLSFPAYRRVATYLTLPRQVNGVPTSEMIRVDPVELEAAVNAGPGLGEPTFGVPLAGATVPPAVLRVRPTLDELRVQSDDLKDRWPSRTDSRQRPTP